MNKVYPENLLQFERAFQSENDCRAYLIRMRWPAGAKCPKCGHGQFWQTKRGSMRCRRCRAHLSVTAGTILHRTHLPLRVWFRAIWWATNQKSGINALGLQRTLGLGSYGTAWMCLHKLRRAMIRAGREPLSGTVEVDEMFIGGYEKKAQAGGRSPSGNKAIVIIAAEVREKGMGRIRLAQIMDTSERSLMSFAHQMIAPGSAIVTDGWRGYASLERRGYLHWPRAVTTGERDASRLLPRVHRVASLFKRWLLGIHQGKFSKKQLSYYLDEFVFRFNRRSSPQRGMLFYRLLQQAVATDPTPYKSIIGRAS